MSKNSFSKLLLPLYILILGLGFWKIWCSETSVRRSHNTVQNCPNKHDRCLNFLAFQILQLQKSLYHLWDEGSLRRKGWGPAVAVVGFAANFSLARHNLARPIREQQILVRPIREQQTHPQSSAQLDTGLSKAGHYWWDANNYDERLPLLNYFTDFTIFAQ